jgi:hypothetical protein
MRCYVAQKPGQPWKATGRFNENHRGLRRAEVQCETCGYVWSTGLPDAIEAGEAVAASLPREEPIQERLAGMLDEEAVDVRERQVGSE